MMPNDDLAGVH